MKRNLPAFALVLTSVACGSYGDPLPPLRPLPPPVGSVRVAQRGIDAVIRFAPVPPAVGVEGTQILLDRVELLVLTERYPVLEPETLAVALERERRDRLDAAQETAERAAGELERERALALALEEQEEEQEEQQEQEAATEEEAAPEEPDEDAPSAEELLLRKVPGDVRAEWRTQEVAPELILEAAGRLEQAVDLLWNDLRLPAAIVDLRRPPELPDPVQVIAAATRVAATLSYEGTKETAAFLEQAVVTATIPLSEIDEHRVGESIELIHNIGAPPGTGVQTRYYIAVRTVSETGVLGQIGSVLALAPSPVPAPPDELTVTTTASGALVAWKPPAADITGQLLEPEQMRYSVYRRPAEAKSFPDAPVNPLPLAEPELLDTAITWDETYVYEVRARRATLVEIEAAEQARRATNAPQTPSPLAASVAVTGPVKESAGRTSEPVEIADVFPPAPPSALQAVRAGATVTVRWSASAATDLAGYRVYRHRAPAPELPRPIGAAPEVPAVTAEAAGAQEAAEQAEEAEEEAAEAEGEEAAAGAGQQEDAAKPAQGPQRRIRRNLLLADGWEMLTAVPITELRFIDPAVAADVEWVYVVEAVDKSGNVSTPLAVTVPGPGRP